MTIHHILRSALFGSTALLAGASGVLAAEVNIYTSREPALVQPLLDAFTAETGVKVNTVFLKDGLAERVAAEGASSPADILMAVDVGNMADLVDKNLTQPIESKAVLDAVPATLRDLAGARFILQTVDRGADHVVGVLRTERLGDDILDADHLEHGAQKKGSDVLRRVLRHVDDVRAGFREELRRPGDEPGLIRAMNLQNVSG